MLNVALTGNIAAGKSTVVELLRRWGATIIDADELTGEAQAQGGEVLAAIARRFGSDVLAPDGSLDRAALRSKVMGDQAGLDALNAIVHPAVRRRRDELAREARQRGDVLVVNDIPLLFEVLDPGQFDLVVLVDAAVPLRRTRLRAMRGLSNEAAPTAAVFVERAWQRAGRPGVLVLLSDDPDPVAVRLDLRPWGYERLRLAEPGAAGVAPRPDLFPEANPLP